MPKEVGYWEHGLAPHFPNNHLCCQDPPGASLPPVSGSVQGLVPLVIVTIDSDDDGDDDEDDDEEKGKANTIHLLPPLSLPVMEKHLDLCQVHIGSFVI